MAWQPDCDVAVIGAGIQGVGVAQAMAAAGYRVQVLEKDHPAAGTSSKSSKLIHGGLRYLETFQWRLVRSSLHEREILLRIAPDLVHMVPFHIPVYRGMRRGPWTIRAGLSLYALLGNLRPEARFSKLSKDAWAGLDGLKTEGLRAVYRYFDGQTDDAMLCRAVLASACELGAEVALGAEVISAEADSHGWTLRYRKNQEVLELHARTVVNAGGPFVAQIADHLSPKPPHRAIDLVGGTHIELPGKLEAGIYYTEAPSDGRAVFTIPWKGHTMVGTTEHPARSPENPVPTEQEIEYLLGVYRHHFPAGSTELVDAWAGLRVLPRADGSLFRRSREVTLVGNHPRRPSLVSIYGGKLTGYRSTAAKVEETIVPSLGPAPRRADTATLRLPKLPLA
ncbi:MAG: glycerol-3-phosphate dehydrogenase/oxidase [Planctomycetes bacterium]|nr:glycerol-3-phosphate dehydrogenase/oxidase [Planctomycetota bacterium]MCB9911144.1 glycerol-3-phosphate dehydrogenase/oxidase [Planctomycetota bacterium]HPF13606.1 glycerol-3-phosphate dehydrogenase/oxidase [Planctomycetota bacterium]HRV80796.1 glycerol-3-phosphate dehydrogenase/oxidase [Planctomycetota bacterium]